MAEKLAIRVTISEFQKTINNRTGKIIVSPSFNKIVSEPVNELLEILEIYYEGASGAYRYVSDKYQNKPCDAVIAFFNYYHKDYDYFSQQIKDMKVQEDNFIPEAYDLISIDKNVLRSMAQDHTPREEIAGRFIAEVRSNFPDIVDRLDAKSALIFAAGVNEYTQDVLGKANEQISEADARTREAFAAKETAETTEGIGEAISYWNTKYKSHRDAKWWMFSAFVFVLAAGICAVFFGESLLPGAPGGENGDAGYKWAHYLRVVIVPTLAVAWLLRLISRQFITHMVLQEDARLRQTLVRTFLGLQRNADAEIADKERAHMLEAIFRPLPVTPSSDVNQPSFADIAKLSK